MLLALDALVFLAGLPSLAASFYLFALAALARKSTGHRVRTATPTFAVLVPAHNEERGIAETIESLKTLVYPTDRFQIIVIADNCSDKTASLARASGARVLERIDLSQRGKGFALKYAFDTLSAEGVFDAYAIIDADTSVSPNLLDAFALELEHGAHAVQAHYTVRNPQVSWRTRLMTLALTLFHGVRSLGRERLQLSVGLRGNGMCFSKELVRVVPHAAFSIVEDLEYGIQIGLQGYRVHNAANACVYGDMVANERDSRSQRQRWEAGRRAIAREYGPRLIAEGLRKRSLLLFDLGIDVLLPPLASLVAYVCLGSLISLSLIVFFGQGLWLFAPFGLATFGIVFYVLSGVVHSGLGARALLDLLWAPPYIVWKLAIRALGLGAPGAEWVRTNREKPGSNQ